MPAYRKPFQGSGAALFGTPDDFFSVLFGAPDQNAHVTRWHQHLRLKHGYYATFHMEGPELEALEAATRTAKEAA